MRALAKSPSRAVLICGAVLLAGSTGNINAQQVETQAQAQTENRAEIANFDAFLDAHVDIDVQLRANPSLLNNAEYLENHPQLRAFLDEHPRIRQEARENADLLVRRQNRFDTREQREASRDRDTIRSNRANGRNPNPDLTEREIASMDRFL